jgi:hypothetical protein
LGRAWDRGTMPGPTAGVQRHRGPAIMRPCSPAAALAPPPPRSPSCWPTAPAPAWTHRVPRSRSPTGLAAAVARASLRFDFPYRTAGTQGAGPAGRCCRRPCAKRDRRWHAPGPLVLDGQVDGRPHRHHARRCRTAGAAAVVVFGYPFHPPKEAAAACAPRISPTLRTPTLILQGERDEFGTRDEVAGYASWRRPSTVALVRRRRPLAGAAGAQRPHQGGALGDRDRQRRSVRRPAPTLTRPAQRGASALPMRSASQGFAASFAKSRQAACSVPSAVRSHSATKRSPCSRR